MFSSYDFRYLYILSGENVAPLKRYFVHNSYNNAHFPNSIPQPVCFHLHYQNMPTPTLLKIKSFFIFANLQHKEECAYPFIRKTFGTFSLTVIL